MECLQGVPRLRWGIVGASVIARQFIPGLVRAGQEVAAIASRRPGAGEQLVSGLDQFIPEPDRRGVRFYEGPEAYDALFHDPDVQAIYVGLANHQHREAVLAAARAGKPVLCEKPLARNSDEAAEMVAACRRAGVPLMEGFMYRYLPATLFALALRPHLGPLLSVRASFTGRYAPTRPNYRSHAGLGGGALLDLGCYTVHTSRLFLAEESGEPTVLAASGRFAPAGGDEPEEGIDLSVSALLSFAGQATAFVECSFETDGGEQRFTVRGETGALEVWPAYNPHGAPVYLRVWGRQVADAARELVYAWTNTHRAAITPVIPEVAAEVGVAAGDLLVRFSPADPFAREAASFASWVYHGATGPDWPRPLPPEDSLGNMQVLDAILNQARAGR